MNLEESILHFLSLNIGNLVPRGVHLPLGVIQHVLPSTGFNRVRPLHLHEMMSARPNQTEQFRICDEEPKHLGEPLIIVWTIAGQRFFFRRRTPSMSHPTTT